MKSLVIHSNAKSALFPRLLKSNVDGVVVLFTGDSIGTVVGEGSVDKPLGFFSDDWNMKLFGDFTGTITLSNEG